MFNKMLMSILVVACLCLTTMSLPSSNPKRVPRNLHEVVGPGLKGNPNVTGAIQREDEKLCGWCPIPGCEALYCCTTHCCADDFWCWCC